MKRVAVLVALCVAACSPERDDAWLGYAEGEPAMISAPAAGWIAGLSVERGDQVSEGQTLFSLDDTQQSASTEASRAAIAAVEAELVQARAELAYAQKDFERQTNLVREQAGAVAALDLSRSKYEAARARVAQLQAQANQNRAALEGNAYQLSQRTIVSRISGRVQDIYFRQGEYAPAMTPVLSVLPPNNVFVRFFVPESQFNSIRLGQEVSITCDGCNGALKARISFIAAREEFTPPVIYSVGSREKLVFKVEARATGGLPLNPGQPVQVRPL